MGGWTVSNMGGEVPLKDDRLLPDNHAVAAWNVDLNSGRLEGLPLLELVQDLSSVAGAVNKAYRLPGPTPLQPDIWVPLRTIFASVVRSPLANDTLHRIYWTESDGTGAYWNTYDRLVAGLPAYRLGFMPVENYWMPNAVSAGGSIPMDAATSVAVAAPGTGYAPGAVMAAPGGALGIGQSVTQIQCNTTKIVTLTIAQGGSGGTDGTAKISGTTGAGALWTGTAVIAGGTITSVTLTSAGAYTANPVLGYDPITVDTSSYTIAPVQVYTQAYINYANTSNDRLIFGNPNVTNILNPPGSNTDPVALEALSLFPPRGPGDFTTVPGVLAGPGVGLTGAAMVVTMGLANVSIHFAGGYLEDPTNPVALVSYGTGGGSGGTVTLTVTPNAAAPEVERSYLFTYVDEFGAESSPSVPSAVVSGASDGVWTIYGLSNVPPANPVNTNYPTVVKIRLYRTITGTTTGANFYQVVDIPIPPGVGPAVGYVDTSLDVEITGSNTLQSAAWASPVAGLDGLISLPGGMLCGFTANTVHFCQPNHPHAWPVAYDLSAQYQIVGLSVWQSNLVVLTQGFPMTGSGTSPASYVLTQVQVPEPCISRGSILSDLLGVYYASPNGLVMLNYYGMSNQTQLLITRKQWITHYNAKGLIACRHRSQYLALNGLGTGILIDFAEGRRGVVELNTFNNAGCMWNDVYAGDVYVIANKMVYRWDSTNTGPMIWRWRSKRWSNAEPLSLGACQITLTEAVRNTPAVKPTLIISPGVISDGAVVAPPVPDSPAIPTLFLPAGVNATFRLWANDDYPVIIKNLTQEVMIFRLPSGFKSFDWQFELISCVPVLKVELASTMEELRKL